MPTLTSKPHATIGQRLSRLALFGLVLGATSLCSVADAQEWAVRDDGTHGYLNSIEQHTNDMKNAIGDAKSGGDKTVNANLDAINKRLMIGPYTSGRPGDRVKDPTQALPADSTQLIQDPNTRCGSLPQPQQDNCQKIVQIQNAQYQYMLTMYANTKTRDDMLRQILQQRSNISSDDPNALGRLEDNTNQLTALYNLIALDQQQMQTVNYAYEANLKYLQEEQSRLARAANTGKPASQSGLGISLPGGGQIDLSGAVNAAVAGAALKLALKDAQSTAPAGMKTLHITDGM
ncbi:hypothetical protein P3W33_00290 [Luteibacter sp. PPL552]